MSALARLLPAGLDRYLDWQRKFRSVGLSPWHAMRAAASEHEKRAFVQSRIEHLPPSLRAQLGRVVDIGANEGQWALALLAIARPTHLEVFEPNPRAFAALERALSMRSEVRLHPIALGAAPSELPLLVTGRSDFASFLAPSETVQKYYGTGAGKVQSRVVVRVDTLDNVLRDRPAIDLLKIDVQGFERQVLAGATETLRRTRAVLIEANFVRHYEGDDTFGGLTDLLAGHGFGLWDMSPPFRAANGRALWCDAVFVNQALSDER